MKVIIFGTGSTAEEAIQYIDKGIEVLAVSDNDASKWGQVWNNYKVICPDNIKEYQYDYILICSMYTSEIIESLMLRGISRKYIVPYYLNYDYNEQIQKDIKLKNQIFKVKKGKKNKKIALVTRRNSGCNSLALYKNLPQYIKESFSVSLINLEEYRSNWMEYEIVFTTHLEFGNRKNNLNIETWHGLPIKAIGELVKNGDNLGDVNSIVDYFISYSNYYSYLMSSLCKIDLKKFKTTGIPRNDFLSNKNARTLISRLINQDITNKKIIYYLPTFRSRKGKESEGDSFQTRFQNLDKLDLFLNEKNCYLLIKKHPFDCDLIRGINFRNIFVLDDLDFNKLGIDLYETLGGSDMLVTDYSSVYFDYLLLNKPIIFWTPDQEIYYEKRGFLHENLDNMMPGPIVKNIESLMDAINGFIADQTWFSDHRVYVKKLVHAYDDFNSSKRVWDMFIEAYKEGEFSNVIK